MKITIIGAAGVRTPLILRSIVKRQDAIGLDELCLMDIDHDHLVLIGALTSTIEKSSSLNFTVTRTTDPRQALAGADFVITTFRVGGIESRVVDERVPLDHGILGQETTGAGGFAMGIRSIPVLIDYVNIMKEVCPNAWLINFANPAGMLTEAVIRQTGWERAIGICDGPAAMHTIISAAIGQKPEDVYLDYFGLNHLGWIKGVIFSNQDYLPDLLEMIKSSGYAAMLPFDPAFILSLGMIPNEYLYYYYCNARAVSHILNSAQCRGEQIASENQKLFALLKKLFIAQDYSGMQVVHQAYLERRGMTYMVMETGKQYDELPFELTGENPDEGYAGVALNLIEALVGNHPRTQILNVANRQAVSEMNAQDVLEIPTRVSRDEIQPLKVTNIPAHCLGLMQQVKHYEHLTIEAATEGSYAKAKLALTLHPLVRDFELAGAILDEYIARHHPYFPSLK